MLYYSRMDLGFSEPAPIYNYLINNDLLPQPRRLSSKDDARARAAVEVAG